MEYFRQEKPDRTLVHLVPADRGSSQAEAEFRRVAARIATVCVDALLIHGDDDGDIASTLAYWTRRLGRAPEHVVWDTLFFLTWDPSPDWPYPGRTILARIGLPVSDAVVDDASWEQTTLLFATAPVDLETLKAGYDSDRLAYFSFLLVQGLTVFDFVEYMTGTVHTRDDRVRALFPDARGHC